jgi:hypothetical protein
MMFLSLKNHELLVFHIDAKRYKDCDSSDVTQDPCSLNPRASPLPRLVNDGEYSRPAPSCDNSVAFR